MRRESKHVTTKNPTQQHKGTLEERKREKIDSDIQWGGNER